jgi:vacuolar-type H+-ATPase subunit F/Vma7
MLSHQESFVDLAVIGYSRITAGFCLVGVEERHERKKIRSKLHLEKDHAVQGQVIRKLCSLQG